MHLVDTTFEYSQIDGFTIQTIHDIHTSIHAHMKFNFLQQKLITILLLREHDLRIICKLKSMNIEIYPLHIAKCETVKKIAKRPNNVKSRSTTTEQVKTIKKEETNKCNT